MKIAVLTAHRGSISWTRMIESMRSNEKIYIDEIFAFNDNEYRSSLTKVSKFILRFKTFFYFPLSILSRAKYINKNYDAIIVITSPFFLPYITVKFINKPNSIILYNDIYPEALIKKNLISFNGLFYKYFLFLQKRTYIKSDYSVFICKEHYELAKCKYSFSSEFKYKIINVPSHLDTNDNSILLVKTHIFCIYSGNIGLFHDFELFMNFLSYIDGNVRLKFIFNTNGASKSRFEKQLKINFFRLLDSGTVCIGNTVSPSEYEELMNTSQIGIIFQDQNAGTIVFPSKFASMLVSGQAILAFINEDCLMAKIILDNDLGWVVDTVNPVLINEVLNEIHNEEALFRKRTNAKKYGIENYSISSVAVNWIDLLKNL